MPRGVDWFNFIYVTVMYAVMVGGLAVYIAIENIYLDWPKYRCNPVYMPFSKNLSEDFTYCVQDMQLNYMGHILAPVWKLMTGLAALSVEVFSTLNQFRKIIAFIREYFLKVVTFIIGLCQNTIVAAQRLAIAMKDMVGKLLGVMMTLLYMLSSIMYGATAAWNGPPGGIIRALCFHPHNEIELKDGRTVKMEEVRLGDVLKNGSEVTGMHKFKNVNDEPYYRISEAPHATPVLVTGEHFIYDDAKDKFIMVKDHEKAVRTDYKTQEMVCLDTSDHKMSVGGFTFWDYHDDDLKYFYFNKYELGF